MEDEHKPTWNKYDKKKQTKNLLLWAFVIGVFVWGASYLDFRFDRVLRARFPLSNFLGRMLPPDFRYIPGNIIYPLIETIQMAFLGTLLGIILAIPVTWFAAYNISPFKPISYYIGRFLTVFARSVHVFIWGMILVAILGFGPLPGVIALGIFSVGFLGKTWSEEIENIDWNQVEAIEATGANWIQVIFFGVIPQVIPAFVGLSIYRWDINLRASAVLGIVGAGGLGLELMFTINRLAYHRTAAVLLVIIIVVIFSEAFSAYIRGKFV